MSASLAFLVMGLGQLVIYIVMRLFIRRAVDGRPSFLLRAIAALMAIVAVAFLAAAGWLFAAGPE